MGWKYTREMARKWVHLLSTFFIVIYLTFRSIFNHQAGIFALVVLLGILLFSEFMRIDVKKKTFFISMFWWVKRDKEMDTIGSEVLFLISSIVCFAAFDVRIAVTAILMATFGDLMAALVGKKFGKHPLPYPKGKAWEGFLAEIGTNLIVGYLMMRTMADGSIWWFGGSSFGEPLWPVIIIMAGAAAFVETVTEKIDDNLVVPISAGLAGQILLFIISAIA